MSDNTSSIDVANPAERGAEGLTPEYRAAEAALAEAPPGLSEEAIDSILADFRGWLSEARALPEAAPAPTMDLATVVQQFTALRQEVNLQTRASRTVQEQGAQTLEMLHQAQEEIAEHKQEAEAEPDDAMLRPLLKALIDAHDALSLARREVHRKLEQAPATPPGISGPKFELRLPAWAHWLGLRAFFEQALTPVGKPQPASTGFRPVLDTLLVGYEMSQQRLERAMQNHGLETIPCAGEPFDPETMEVVEVIRDPSVRGTQVIEEVRRGYLWHGRLFRFAQVRVAKP